jgi:hypothetical protein
VDRKKWIVVGVIVGTFSIPVLTVAILVILIDVLRLG